MVFMVFLKGMILGAGMIMPLGVQNSYVLSQGIKRNHHFTAAYICVMCDIVLIGLGIFGGGKLIATSPTLMAITGWGGVLFLVTYAGLALKNVVKNNYQTAERPNALGSRKRIITVTLAVTLLNPHVYLDTVILLGGIGSRYQGASQYAFAAGTMVASFLWFTVLASTAARLAPVLGTPKAQRIIDGVIAAIMLTVAYSVFIGL